MITIMMMMIGGNDDEDEDSSNGEYHDADMIFVKSFTPSAADFTKFRDLPEKTVICDIFTLNTNFLAFQFTKLE